jgi:hypothetical protein
MNCSIGSFAMIEPISKWGREEEKDYASLSWDEMVLAEEAHGLEHGIMDVIPT